METDVQVTVITTAVLLSVIVMKDIFRQIVVNVGNISNERQQNVKAMF